MLITQYYEELSYRTEDDMNHTRFSLEQKLYAIKNAYYQVYSIVDDKHLSEFKLADQTVSISEVDPTGRPYGIISSPYALRLMSAYDMTNNRQCKIVTKDEYDNSGPNYKYGTLVSLCDSHNAQESTSSSYTNILYVSPSTSSIFIKYIRSLAGENYDGNALTDNIPVTETLSPVVLGIAESELWKSDNAEGRAKSAYAEAINILTALEAQ